MVATKVDQSWSIKVQWSMKITMKVLITKSKDDKSDKKERNKWTSKLALIAKMDNSLMVHNIVHDIMSRKKRKDERKQRWSSLLSFTFYTVSYWHGYCDTIIINGKTLKQTRKAKNKVK